MKEIALEINRLQFPVENLSIPRGQKNKNATNPVNGEQKKAPFAGFSGTIPTEAPKTKIKK